MDKLQKFLDSFPVVTFLVVVLALAGAVALVISPETLATQDDSAWEAYYKGLGIAAGGLGVLGVGRGLAKRR
jgi:hypothetical protein